MKVTVSFVLIAASAVTYFHLCHKYQTACLENFLFNRFWSEQKVSDSMKQNLRKQLLFLLIYSIGFERNRNYMVDIICVNFMNDLVILNLSDL